jgi:HSP20 family protein
MGIIDKVEALLPWRAERREPQPPSRPEAVSLRDDLDHWLQRLMEDPWRAADSGWMPSADLYETDDEVVVTVEVPGLDRGDLDLMITPGGLIVRGEKREVKAERRRDLSITPEGLIVRRQEREGDKADPRRDVYVSECRYGSFVRTVPLPPGVEVDRAEARMANGVLTVRFPKQASRPGTRRIAIEP